MRRTGPRLDWLNLTLWSALAALWIILWLLAAIGLRTVLSGGC